MPSWPCDDRENDCDSNHDDDNKNDNIGKSVTDYFFDRSSCHNVDDEKLLRDSS